MRLRTNKNVNINTLPKVGTNEKSQKSWDNKKNMCMG